MSNILIRGMKLPIFEHQSWDIRHGADGKWYIVDTNAETSDGEWHEIVPIPPHGDLIDRDALMKGEGRYIISFGKEGIDVAEINRAPTIIPASE